MAGLGVLVAIQAPQFLSASNLTSVLVLSAIIAIAAVGEALVIITRNVDLSVEAMMGLVAFSVADLLKFHVVGVPEAMICGLLLGLALGMFNGFLVAVVHVPSIVATLGTLSIYRGLAFLAAGGKQVTLTDLPHGYTDPATQLVMGVPLFVVIAVVITIVVGIFMRQTEAGRQVYAVGSNPEAATIQGIRTGTVIFAVFTVCGLLSGVAGILWGIEFGAIDATAASGCHAPGGGRRGRRRRQHLRRFGLGHGCRAGRRLPGLHLQCAHPGAAVAVLAPGGLRRGHPGGRHARRVRRAALRRFDGGRGR